MQPQIHNVIWATLAPLLSQLIKCGLFKEQVLLRTLLLLFRNSLYPIYAMNNVEGRLCIQGHPPVGCGHWGSNAGPIQPLDYPVLLPPYYLTFLS